MEGIVYAPIACTCNSRLLSQRVEVYVELIKNKINDVLALDLVTVDNILEFKRELEKLKNPSYLPEFSSLQSAIKNKKIKDWFKTNNFQILFQRQIEYNKFKESFKKIDIPFEQKYNDKYILSLTEDRKGYITYGEFLYNLILTQEVELLDKRTRKAIFKDNETSELEEFIIPTLVEYLTNATTAPEDEDSDIYDKNYTNLLKTLNNKFIGKRTSFKIEASDDEKDILKAIFSKYFDFQPFDKTTYPVKVRELVNKRIENMEFGELRGEEAFNVRLSNLSINKICCKNQVKSVGDSMLSEMNQYYEKYPFKKSAIEEEEEQQKKKLLLKEEPVKIKYGDDEGTTRKLRIYESSITDFKARKKTTPSVIYASRPTHGVQEGYVDKINDFKIYLSRVKKSDNEEAKRILKNIERRLEKFERRAKLQLAKQYEKISNSKIISTDRVKKVNIKDAKVLSLRNAALMNKISFEESKQDAIKALQKRGIRPTLDPIIQATNLKIDFGHREFLIRKLQELGIEEVNERYSKEIDVYDDIDDISISSLINNIIVNEKTPVRNKDAAYEDFLKDVKSVELYIEMQKAMRDV